MRKLFRTGSLVVVMILSVSALAFAQLNAERKISDVFVTDEGKSIPVTTEYFPSDGIGVVCGTGKPLHYAGMSDSNIRTFNCDGTGTFVNDCQPGSNTGTFKWGFALTDTDKSKLKVKTFSEWGWGVKTDNKAAVIVMRFKGGCADNNLEGGIIGVNNGKVVQGMGNGYSEK
jgi:hypothetical protein